MSQWRFAPVAPIQILSKLKEVGHLGHYHLVLAHDVLSKPKGFQQLFSGAAHVSDEIIVDNSVIELGQPISIKEIHEACQVFDQKDIVAVLPDVLLNRDKTLHTAYAALNEWIKYTRKRNLMFVPQGSTYDEFIRSAEDFTPFKEITHIGVARNLLRVNHSRSEFIHVVRMLYPKVKIHLLGFSDSLIDDFICARMPEVRGIDSAVPLRIAELDLRLSLDPFKVYPPRSSQPNWWSDGKYNDLVLKNVTLARRWAGEQFDD